MKREITPRNSLYYQFFCFWILTVFIVSIFDRGFEYLGYNKSFCQENISTYAQDSKKNDQQNARIRRSIKNWPCVKNKYITHDSRRFPIWIQSAGLIDRISEKTPLDLPMLGHGRLSGTVTIEVFVDTDGKVQCARGIKGHPLAIASAMDAVPKWTFRPYIINGEAKPVIGTLTIPYDFRRD